MRKHLHRIRRRADAFAQAWPLISALLLVSMGLAAIAVLSWIIG
jgi:hypothetical protein